MKLRKRVLMLPRTAKRAVALAVDIGLCLVTVAAAFALRLDQWSIPQGSQFLAYIGSIVIALPIFVSYGLYRAIFRHAGRGAFTSVFRACLLYALIYSIIFALVGIPGVPRSVGLMQPILLLVAIGASRFFAHYLLGGGYQELLNRGTRRRVLIYGAGSAGRQLAAALANSHDMQLVGFVDDDSALSGNVLNGKRIYPTDNLPKLLLKLSIDDLLLAIPSATRKRRAEIIESLRGVVVSIRTVPGLMDIAHGRIKMQDLRELDITDLLGRETVPPNQMLLARNIVGKVVLVTGAGGSIGSEICRQVIQLRPKKLLLLESSEFNLYAIDQELAARNADELGRPLTSIISVLASIQDADRLATIFEQWCPDTVYHAAAYKHVPIIEANPSEGICNNVLGTLNLVKQAIGSGTADFVLISTDKAVRPTNVMGATKRLAELVLQAYANGPAQTRLSMVRFGNVLGSSGSVVPLFRQQIKAGGPLTLTHPEITRYFMTIPEAALLVIQAGAMAKGGEVFVLDMGEPVKIIDLARRMIELSGLRVQDESRPDGDIAISYVGLRPGEKLFEELLIGNNALPTKHSRIMKARESFIPLPQLEQELEALFARAKMGDSQAVIDGLCRLVPEAQNLSDNSQRSEKTLICSA